MEYVKNGISGQKRYVVNNNKVFDAKTGRHIYTVDNGVLRSAITGDIIANGSAFVSSGESIDLSFVTATQDKILEGFVGADKDGGQVHGSMPIAQVTETDNKVTVSKGYLDETKEFTVGGSIEFYKCAAVHEATAGDGYVITGAGVEAVNGTYTTSTNNTSGYSKVYANENGVYLGYQDGYHWEITDQIVNWYYRSTNGEDPTAVTWSVDGGTEPLPTITKVEGNPASWDGNKAVIGEDGKFFFDELLKQGLTYGVNLTPIVGNVYPDGCLYLIAGFIDTALTYWQQLSADIQNGMYTTDRLGEIIEVKNTALADVGLSAGKIQFEVVAIDNADLVDKSKQHSITLMAKSVLFAKSWNNEAGVNRWSTSDLRAYLQSNLMNSLDSELLPQIATVNRTHWVKDSAAETVQDTIFLPSHTEIGFGANGGIYEGLMFDKMTDNNARKRGGNGQSYYWLSSAEAEYNSGHTCYMVNTNSGARDTWGVEAVTGVVPCFVIA